MYTYDLVLEGHEATLENAIEHAKHQDWSSISKTKNNYIAHKQFEQTVNGIDIWYCYGACYYFFTDNKD